MQNVDSEIIAKTKKLSEEVTADLDRYAFHEAAQKLYDFIWHEYADKYIESTKDRNDPETLYILHSSFVILLKLLHPFMPFVTEEIWQKLPDWKGKKMLIVENWPD